MAIKTIAMAVLSDLHAFQASDARKGVSYLPANPVGNDPDPFQDIERLARESGGALDCDLVLCPGDICDQADFHGFQYAWRKLHDLKETLSANELIATCGNHDLDSRNHWSGDDDPDPKGLIQSVAPQFPFSDDNTTNHYWARNFSVVYPLEGVRVVVLNTSAFHGGGRDECGHGRVSRRTIDTMVRYFSGKKEDEHLYLVNILLCHHHLKPLRAWNSAPDKEYVLKGGELIDAITEITGKPWLIIHGHRHAPNIEHSQSPHFVMFGASSFSKPELNHLNQFHHIRVTADEESAMPLVGVVQTWTWSGAKGWQQTALGEDVGLPAECGFGCAVATSHLARQIARRIEPRNFLQWNELYESIPHLRFLPPAELRNLLRLLKEKHVNVSYDGSGKLFQAGKM